MAANYLPSDGPSTPDVASEGVSSAREPPSVPSFHTNLVLSASHVQRDEGRSTGALPRVYSVVSMTLRNTHEIDDGRSLDPGRVTDTDEIDIS